MKKKECPSCAMEIDTNSKECPICGYEFPATSLSMKIVVFLLVALLLYFFLF
ncbi:hypothetical protein FNH22_30495 [Fulvivirga sp. M361]|uniref:zinc ribbon domain-containing protein n=1 Tax=Fulvivirga sp. M361 TaxID=2594266 RepID=UPI00117A9D98|nr:zinc ribbon domain-containing protein [Fulvivirga sp. M361]TRX47151.1 hypothetical protein FNH22_30495 [Fulvivirga sp. M361]